MILLGKNTGIFIDYDNVFITLERYYEKYDIPDSIKIKVISELISRFQDDNLLIKKAYCDFNKVQLTNEIFDSFKSNQVQLSHVYSGKNASDVTLIIDIIKSIYNDKNIIDKYIIVSSDSDMLPVIQELKYHGKTVIVFYFDCNTNVDYKGFLNTYKDEFCSLEEILNLKVYQKKDFSIYEDNFALEKILILINQSIDDIYQKFINRKEGKIVSAGTCNKGNLKDHLEKYQIFVREDIISGFAIESLFSSGILYEYKVPDIQYSTILISTDFLIKKGINLDNLKTEKDFQFPL